MSHRTARFFAIAALAASCQSNDDITPDPSGAGSGGSTNGGTSSAGGTSPSLAGAGGGAGTMATGSSGAGSPAAASAGGSVGGTGSGDAGGDTGVGEGGGGADDGGSGGGATGGDGGAGAGGAGAAGQPQGGANVGGAGGGAGPAGAAGAGTLSQCPAVAGGVTELALLPIASGGAFCMDVTPITQSQYATFAVAHAGDLSFLPPSVCASQTSYEIPINDGSDTLPNACPPGVYDPKTKPDFAMECVTWCQAYAYCASVGKRLCGKEGGGAIPDVDAAFSAAGGGQFFAACTQNGNSTYPWGNTYSEGCAPSANGPVQGISASCSGPGAYSKVFGLSGPVLEWEDACVGNDCAVAGRPYVSASPPPEQALRCDAGSSLPPGIVYSGVGFRCCYDGL